MNNIFIKLLCSIPVILVSLYFVPFIGVCLIILRFFVKRSKNYKAQISLIVCGLLLLIPKCISMITHNDNNIPYLNKIMSSSIYPKLLVFSKRLIIIGIVFLIISFVFRNILESIFNKISEYIQKDMEQDYKIKQENDLKMREKRERAKNTHVIKCPYCGSENMLTSNIGTCKYCRRKIEYKSLSK